MSFKHIILLILIVKSYHRFSHCSKFDIYVLRNSLGVQCGVISNKLEVGNDIEKNELEILCNSLLLFKNDAHLFVSRVPLAYVNYEEYAFVGVRITYTLSTE